MKAWRTFLRAAVFLLLTAAYAAPKKNQPPAAAPPAEPAEQEEPDRFETSAQLLFREEVGLQLARPDSVLNPNDVLGTPRMQNRFMGSLDMKMPFIGGSGVNPLLEFVIADTFIYLQNEGKEPTPAKQQISDFRNFLKEAYFNIRPASWFLLSAGRRNITDGTGYSRCPTDFLANPTTLPGNNFDNRFRIKNREGDVLARTELHWNNGSIAYTYVPQLPVVTRAYNEVNLLNNEVDRFTQFNRSQAHWAKLYQFVAGFDVSLHYFYRRRHQVGLGVSRVFGDALELHLDASAFRGSDVQVARKTADAVTSGQVVLVPEAYDFSPRSQDIWYAHALAGGQYTFENKINLAMEYYYNGDGYSPAEQATWTSAMGVAGKNYENPAFALPAGNPYRLFLLAANLNFNFLSMGQHYRFIRISDPELFGSSKWEAAVFYSSTIDKLSGMAAAELTYKVNKNFLVQAIANTFFGIAETEGLAFYNSQAYLIALEMQF